MNLFASKPRSPKLLSINTDTNIVRRYHGRRLLDTVQLDLTGDTRYLRHDLEEFRQWGILMASVDYPEPSGAA